MRNGEILYLLAFLHKGRFPHQFSMWCDKKKEAEDDPMSWSEHWILMLPLAVMRDARAEQVWRGR